MTYTVDKVECSKCRTVIVQGPKEYVYQRDIPEAGMPCEDETCDGYYVLILSAEELVDEHQAGRFRDEPRFQTVTDPETLARAAAIMARQAAQEARQERGPGEVG